MRFDEFGYLARSITRTGYNHVMWFIDRHDTANDIQHARSFVLAFAEAQQHKPRALCVVHNMGRPRLRRRHIDPVSRRWWCSDDDTATAVVTEQRGRAVAWEELAMVVDAELMQRDYGRIKFMQLSYKDADVLSLAMDWIINDAADQ